MIHRFHLLRLVCVTSLTLPAFARVFAESAAFPGAEGAGAQTTGGRGGQVVHVTNLNPSGPGSLQDAVSAANRIVVFDVSGIIDLGAGGSEKNGKGGNVVVSQPHITIAGQTASGEGICLKGGTLHVSADDVMVRYLRSRRGFIVDGSTGDCIDVKSPRTEAPQTGAGTSSEAFEKKRLKKEARGKGDKLKVAAYMENIVIDHCSTSWATDENLSVTHPNKSTISWSIAAEGLDYANAKQTPPNHSEGSLWGCSTPDGRSTMHHMLYAHNRLRNPRTTGGSDAPPVLNFYNSVVYDWSENASHTGKERVLLNWLNNYFKPGPSTPADVRSRMFEWSADPASRIYVKGNVVEGSDELTRDNKLAVFFHEGKFKGVGEADRAAMKADQPLPDAPGQLQTAPEAFDSVLDDVGATLPSRDAVDLRITKAVRAGSGKVIDKETDLPEDQRWPDYRSLPPLQDTDKDGIPDFWEKQFGLDPNDPSDSGKIVHGYANIEHYFNNTDPTGGVTPIVYVAATVSRALVKQEQSGEWRVMRTGDLSGEVTVRYTVSGDAGEGKDFEPLSGTVTLPAGQKSAKISLKPLASAQDNKTVIITLSTENSGYHVGCPSQSLVVIRNQP